ncbi:DNA alkylation repair protein [Bacillus sp. PS06]|uniref:DNA alkylation repair protein n=1 Tax=Bacillus sp. PS06 TaxID=2764176 RepID=UPI0017849E24|nr:DNA alkylation repair protein [Bacillus sp. PS06]MBD8067885.1 DNA alkylation repair protein [Bacillus sp. PS06]
MKILHSLTFLFEANRNEENAIAMQKYMKDHFPFLGIKTPLRREIMKVFYSDTEILHQDFLPEFIELLWKKQEREFQYAALDYMNKSLKKINKNHLALLEQLITTKSWWDTVDAIAPHPVGKIAKESPEIIDQTIEGWATNDYLWLRRAAILYQLRYKEETDENRLYRYIILNADSKEFFIQKAIGWALREYSKTNPDSVKKFIEGNKLSKLSIREGSKYI